MSHLASSRLGVGGRMPPALAGSLSILHWLSRAGLSGLLALGLSVQAQQSPERLVPAPTDVLIRGLPLDRSGSFVPGSTAEASLTEATGMARQRFLLAMDQGDPSWLGQAQALLRPWWAVQELPAETLFVRGLVKQGLHDFESSRQDFERALSIEPNRPEFWSWLLALDLVGSRLTQAQSTCQQIGVRFGVREADACQGVIHYRSGQAEQGLRLLDGLVGRQGFREGSAADWLAFHRGEARRVLGQPQLALQVWLKALESGARPHGLRLAAVELLNDLGRFRFAQAGKLNDQEPRSDALLVQAIRSARGLGQQDLARNLTQVFRERLARQTARGELNNERPVLVFLLDVENKPEQALVLARQAWATQREPADAVLYGRAALANQNRDAAKELVTWLEQTGYREVTQQALFSALRALAGQGQR